MANNGMAATSQPLATEIAVEILKKGGTAIDAAISANASTAVIFVLLLLSCHGKVSDCKPSKSQLLITKIWINTSIFGSLIDV